MAQKNSIANNAVLLHQQKHRGFAFHFQIKRIREGEATTVLTYD
jgi:hypothetical protein